MAVKDLVLHGMRWVVGMGERISLWRDPWVPKEGDCMVHSIYIGGIEELQVCDLLREDKASWNEGLVRGIFVEKEADLILSISLSLGMREDR